MNKKNVNKLDTILIIIGIILFVVSCVKTLQTAKVYTALEQEISRSIEAEEKMLEEMKQETKQAKERLEKSEQEVKQTEEILKTHTAALDRNTAVYEKLIQLLEDLTQD